MIRGWDELFRYTLISEHLIRRAIGYYGFPEPTIIREGSSNVCLWDRDQVLDWMIDNEHKHLFVKAALKHKIDVARTTLA